MPCSFLSLQEILLIHQDQISRYGGEEGIRHLDLLKSAVAMPAVTFGGRYLHEDLYEMAAAYLYYIVRDHPFIDGNKRTGTVSALVFLSLNGRPLFAPEEDLFKVVMSVVVGQATKSDLARFIRDWSSP